MRHWFFLAINPDVKSDDPDGEFESAVIGLYSTEEECHASMESAQSDGLFTRQCHLVSDISYLSCMIVDDKSPADCL